MDVLVIGGGIGGLALAHGLRQAGVPVRVFEKTHERTDWLQGYRIHINPAGARALRACLPGPNWQAFTDAAAPGGGFGFCDDRGRDLLSIAESEVAGHYGIGRVALREVLLAGLDVEAGRAFTSYGERGNRIVARFADGSEAEGDLLVGADGANSRVRAQLLPPAAERIDTGVLTVAGRCLTVDRLAPMFRQRATVVIPRGRGSLFTAATGDQVLWGFSDATRHFPAGVERLDAAALTRLVADRMRGWAPQFRALVERSDPSTVNAFRVKSAAETTMTRPERRVTLLGDAIHSMTPMAGIGANTALRDADLLCRTIAGGETIESYEREMLAYGFAAVRQSLRNARQAAHSTVLGRVSFRTGLRVISAAPPLRRRFAAALGN